MTRRDASDQTEHSDFGARKGRIPGFFTVVIGSEAVRLLVSAESQIYVQYPTAEKSSSTAVLPGRSGYSGVLYYRRT